MKKLLVLALVVFGLAACQTEPQFDVQMGGEQEVMLTVSLPEATRASSADGFDLANIAGTDYTLRYILEVYRVVNATTNELTTTCQRFVETSDAPTMVFPVRLAPGYQYQVVAWADIVEKNATDPYADRYYNTQSGLQAISIIENDTVKWNAMDETRDAYTATQTISTDNLVNGVELKLKRPFAKLRVVATDITDIRKVGLEPTKATVVYSQDTPLCRTFNAVTGEVSVAAAKTHSDFATNVYTDVTGEYTLFADYFFVSANGGTVKFSLDVYADDAKQMLIKNNAFNTEIFVERNKLTTIKGDVLTVGGNVEVKVENDLGIKEEISYVDTIESLQDKINNAPDGTSTKIVLGGDVAIEATTRAESQYGLVIPAVKNIVLDLNGHTISQTKAQTGAYAMIDNRGTLTIEDSSEDKIGEIAYGDTGNGGNYVSNTISNSGVLTINGGTIENNSSATVAANGYPHPIDNSGTLTINGGTFTNNANYSTMRIWCTTDDDTIVTINGGTFNGSIDFQTPNASANKGTLTINGGTFNADTYTNCAVRLLGFGADVDEMNSYIMGGYFNGAIALRNWSGSEFNSKVFNITGGTFTVDPSEFVDDNYAVDENNGSWTVGTPIAKVGDTGYCTIDKAIANWTNNSTLTLLADVTLSDVIKISSTEMHTLDLGTYTLTSAKSKNAIEIINNGRSSASYALDIKADATNPGGITASSAVVKTTGKSGVQDRPIIRFYNGVFNASNIINHSGSNGTNSPQFTFYDGVYNGNISTNRAMCIFEGGTFNGRFYMSVDSSSYARIGGGKFKYMDNLYGSALNSAKFTIGSAKGVFDRGVYVDDEGYIVVGGPVITEFGDKFEAKVTNVSVVGSYLPYSSAAEHGLYYTNAEIATANKKADVVLKESID